MNGQKSPKFPWTIVLCIWLCGGLLYLLMGGVAELQSLFEQLVQSSQQASVEPGSGSKQPVESTPQAQTPASVAEAAPIPPSFDVVRADAGGGLVIAGKAQPHWTVRLNLGKRVLKEEKADETGSWMMMIDKAPEDDDAKLSLSAVSPEGGTLVEGRQVVEAPKVQSANSASPNGVVASMRDDNKVQDKQSYTVVRGDSLWRIARKYYGDGASCTKIYRFNRNQIHNPNLIHPNQRFMLSR
jgi:nucleoid-associated protein YgaU